MPRTPQSFKNHTRFLPPLHFFVFPVLLLHVLNALRRVWLAPSLDTALGLLVAAALLTLALVARGMALTVQDRVIRLEMRLRLQEILPPDLRPRIHELGRRQLVALRFASDAEIPALVREILAGTLTTSRAIKERVREWQPDYLRA